MLAREHLAEALALVGQVNEATTHYKRIISQTPYAESLVALAKLNLEQDQPEKAEVFKRKAIQRYESLLNAHPEAMQWHAAEFFLGIGQDPVRALILLEDNLTLRPTSESWGSLAHAQLINGRPIDACYSMNQALKRSVVSVTLKRTAANKFDYCSGELIRF